jgi:hypothetical protein
MPQARRLPQDRSGYLPHPSHRVCYNELGDLYLDKLNKHHLTRNLRPEPKGYTVTLDQKAA